MLEVALEGGGGNAEELAALEGGGPGYLPMSQGTHALYPPAFDWKGIGIGMGIGILPPFCTFGIGIPFTGTGTGVDGGWVLFNLGSLVLVEASSLALAALMGARRSRPMGLACVPIPEKEEEGQSDGPSSCGSSLTRITGEGALIGGGASWTYAGVAGGGTGVGTGVDRLVLDRQEDNCSTSVAFEILFILGRGATGVLGVERLKDGGSIGDPVRLVALLSILFRGVAVCGRLETSVDIAEILGLVADLALGNDGTGVPAFGTGDA